MRAEKQFLTKEYVARLNGSPFFIVAGYQGLKVSHMTELRKRLRLAGAEAHVVKNSVFRVAAKEAGVADLGDTLTEAQVRISRQPTVGGGFDPGSGGFAQFGRVAWEVAGIIERAGHETGQID